MQIIKFAKKSLGQNFLIDNNIIKKSYHSVCEDLWNIYNTISLPNGKLLQEYHADSDFSNKYGNSTVTKDNDIIILKHYYQRKVINRFCPCKC